MKLYKSDTVMTEAELMDIINGIENLSESAIRDAEERQIKLAKPPKSLGGLEDISVKIAGIKGRVMNSIDKSCVVVMCSDNGVFEEGIAATPQSVTMAQTINFTKKLTGVGTLAKVFNSDLLIVDMGINSNISEKLYIDVPFEVPDKIVNRRMGSGTKNIAREWAMTRQDAVECLSIGIEMAKACRDKGYDIIGVGEMGIGNTTTSAAVLSALTGRDSSYTVGRGAGLSDEGLEKKCRIVDSVSEPFRKGRSIEATDVIDILAACGGFDICAMAGVYIGAAIYKLPVVIDGYISAVAALAAAKLAPRSVKYMFASHKSEEKGYVTAIEQLGLKPFLNLGMRLGEGSGCPLAFDIIKGACYIMSDMATFDEAAINDDYIEEINDEKFFK